MNFGNNSHNINKISMIFIEKNLNTVKKELITLKITKIFQKKENLRKLTNKKKTECKP